MKALILAAGLGERLGDITKEKPKAMVQAGGIALIDRAIDLMESLQISQIGVVGGFCQELLQEHLSNRDICFYTNADYRMGNIFSLKAAIDFIDDGTLLMNVDHIYPKGLMEHVINSTHGICAICDFDRTLQSDDMKVKLDNNRKLKKISKTLADFDCGYIGMTFCSKEMIDIYKKAVDQVIKIYGENSCVEFILGHLAANNVMIDIVDASGFGWLEVDTPDELDKADSALMKGS